MAMWNGNLNYNRAVRVCLLAAGMALVLAPGAAAAPPEAQAPAGTLFGTVYDASGAVVPNATVIVSNAELRTRDMTTTGAVGSFEFAGLAAGRYTVEVLKPGFARLRLSDVVLEPNQSRHLPLTLQIGSISERIDVVAAGAKKTAAPEGAPQRVRVGGNVQATKLVKMVKPVYPPAAKAAGIEGAVLLEAVIARDGSVQSLRVMNSQIDPDLARAAVEAVSQWQYEPTLLNGEPVEVLADITVNFTLRPNE